MDTCVDAAGTVIEEFNAEFGAGSINIPTNFDTEVDGEGRDSLTSRVDDYVVPNSHSLIHGRLSESLV